jgi:aminoglycoside phosphotransferase (APT) family kinase protein
MTGQPEDDRREIDVALVRRLIASQCPQWANLPIRPVATPGWDNRTFHLGEAMSVRLPSAERYAAQVEKEHRWLPLLAARLPLPIPAPLAMGAPAFGYPWPWSVYRWLPGDSAAAEPVADRVALAQDRAGFLAALQAAPSEGGPAPGVHNFHRGGALAVYDDETRCAIAALGGDIDAGAALAAWETALRTSWRGAPVWVHGDVAAGNLLVRDGRLAAVIDFGSSGVGDPACDLAVTWTLFDGESRAAFRADLPFDDATWARARAWALWKALIAAAPCPAGDPHGAAPRRVIAEILAEYGRAA